MNRRITVERVTKATDTDCCGHTQNYDALGHLTSRELATLKIEIGMFGIRLCVGCWRTLKEKVEQTIEGRLASRPVDFGEKC